MRKAISKGFTLIELLVVISILAILATVVFVALNPSQRFIDARNSRRWTDVDNYLSAVHTCIVDNGGSATPCVGTLTAATVYEIVNTGIATGCQTSCPAATAEASCAVLDTTLASYLKSMPSDPGGVTTDHTEYSISVNAAGLYTIGSCSAEDGETIEVSR